MNGSSSSQLTGGMVLAAVLIMAAPVQAESAEIRVGVASNFAGALADLAEDFQRRTGHRLVISSGSTGKLFAQIKNGAPYDVFLAADGERPQRLEEEGESVAGTRFTYAIGRLVLWSSQRDLVDGEGKVLTTNRFKRLAIANPVTAPYGRAARQALEALGQWERLEPRLVRGENITQTFQFVASGNAELGLVALAQTQSLRDERGSAWLLPASLYDPIEQQAVLLKSAREPGAARELLDYLRSPTVRKYLESSGYETKSE